MGINVLKAMSNPFKALKEFLTQWDLNKNKVPDVYEHLDTLEAGLLGVADFLDDFDADEAEVLLSQWNMARKSDKRKSPTQIKEIAAKVVLIPAAIRGIEKGVESFESKLKES